MEALKNCQVCPRNCSINRYEKTGYCKSGAKLKINIWQKHFGEEPFISGENGSGTIFFSGCNLRCCFCQNYKISQLNNGNEYSIKELAKIMLSLQSENAHNINLVSPTHFTPQIAEAVSIAKDNGLKIPVVWNTNSYESVKSLKSVENIADIYLADFKYASSISAEKYSGAADYFQVATHALKEMFSQKGNLQFDENGMAVSGVAVRILVLPNDLIDLEKLLIWLKNNLGNDIFLSLMSQYYPTWKAHQYAELSRSLCSHEYDLAIELAEKYQFNNCLIQELDPSAEWTPDFKDN